MAVIRNTFLECEREPQKKNRKRKEDLVPEVSVF